MSKFEIGREYAVQNSNLTAIIVGTMSNGHFVGYTRSPYSCVPRAWNSLGMDQGEYALHLVEPQILGQAQWNALDTYDKDMLKRLIDAFGDKKIVGIKYLRSIKGWGLGEAKNIFERVYDRSWR